MKTLLAATLSPELLTFGKASSTPIKLPTDVYSYVAHASVTSDSDSSSLAYVTEIPFPNDANILNPNQKFWIPVWIRGPESPGSQRLDLMFYYETSQPAEGNSPG